MEDNSLAKLAIQAALEGNWEKAAKINQKILAANPHDADALNRLARACGELGNAEKAKKCYQQVLQLDPANTIALKNLKMLTKSENGHSQNGVSANGNGHKNLPLDIFLAEPGRTKLVNLVNVAPSTTLAKLTAAEKVKMVFKKHQVAIETENGEYLGAIPDDLAHYLISLARLGNDYEVYVKAVRPNSVSILIWEKLRAARFANQPSFIARKQIKIIKVPAKDETPLIEFDESFQEASEV